MSGGHYDYKCFEVSQFAEMVAMTIKERSGSRVEQYTPEYSETIEALPKPLLDKMQVFVDVMRKCADMAKDIEWMMSGDTGEDGTLRDLHRGLVEISAIIDRHYET
jgi:hypothetical protein